MVKFSRVSSPITANSHFEWKSNHIFSKQSPVHHSLLKFDDPDLDRVAVEAFLCEWRALISSETSVSIISFLVTLQV